MLFLNLSQKLNFSEKPLYSIPEPMFSVQTWILQTKNKGFTSRSFYWNLCRYLKKCFNFHSEAPKIFSLSFILFLNIACRFFKDSKISNTENVGSIGTVSQFSGGFVSPVPVICTLCFAAASRPRLALEWSPIQVLTTMAPVSCLPSVILREREYPYACSFKRPRQSF